MTLSTLPGIGPQFRLSDVARATLADLLRRGEATRKDLAADTGLSLPSVTAALAELQAGGCAVELRREQGARGRATLVFGVAEGAGWVIGLDIGSTQVSAVARSLAGRVLDRADMQHSGTPAEAAALAGGLLARLVAGQRRPPLAAALALNQIVPRAFESAACDSVACQVVGQIVASAGAAADTRLMVENNVNCAAVAEHHDGAMRGLADCAYMQIGVGIGLGLFCDGTLVRGGQGASGELAQIPLSWSADEPSPRNAIERAYGSAGLLEQARSRWPVPGEEPRSAEAVLALAEAGVQPAASIVERHAVALGRIAAAAATILDPTVLVLGGGLSRDAGFVLAVQEEFRRRNTRTEVRVSSKGKDATSEGAAILARDLALAHLLGQHHRLLLTRPVLWPGKVAP